MNVIWKRPDGYHDAEPTDFRLLPIGSHFNLWVHKTDSTTFPFRVAGGWEEEAQTTRLNMLVNLLDQADDQWNSFIDAEVDQSMNPRDAYVKETVEWLTSLKSSFKGGGWEVEIMGKAFDAIITRLNATC